MSSVSDFTLKCEAAAAVIAVALGKVLPTGFRGRIHIVVDGDVISPEDVTIEVRPRQRPRSQGTRMN